MSHTSRIIGLAGLEIERVERQQGIEVWAKPNYRPVCRHCRTKGDYPINCVNPVIHIIL